MQRLDDLLKDRISVGKFSNTHTLSGELKLLPYTNATEVFSDLDEVLLFNPEKKSFFFSKVLKVRKSNRLFILKLAGIEDIASAEKLIGFEVFVEKSKMPHTGVDEYYFYELIGCSVFDEQDFLLGTVADVFQTGSNDVMLIQKSINRFETQELLIPLIKQNVISIDKPAKVIKIAKPQYYEDDQKDED